MRISKPRNGPDIKLVGIDRSAIGQYSVSYATFRIMSIVR
ncbi:hypothetical protein CQP30_03735 [Yersinia pestis]|uniref:Uncharacterized protein n=2 Tax=Yersinia pseudotuberculosis complex TaxID=1649845 RepID=A0A384KAI7_YERPE|nr:hypothetical protein BAY22_05465 [Yersinia pestis]AXY32533.1 hypothetical protein CEQ20_03330 [Yersinia pseudotuberculosis]EDM41141.1 hypothetical protein YPE_1928 [Yersinia pestis CA88-4125]KJG86522.1 hypothetical protein RN23_05200 [Yersinia pestis subsp. microtus bv. Ulegeica]KKM50958.1 hypothetical protein KD37_11150 [Yersinia pestis subsp. pestis bv. Orientalis]KPD46350.1 hypothetical protein AC472_05405 [Yersinia pestis subsp. microtus bv. Caucasica]KPD54947.1 hypothetical protein AC